MIELNNEQMTRLTGRKQSALNWLTGQLPVTPHGRRTPRRYTLFDGIVVLVAQKLQDRGLTIGAAIEVASAISNHIQPMMLDEKLRVYCFIKPADDRPGEFHFTITSDPAEAFDVLESVPGAMPLNVRTLVTDAMTEILVASRKAAPHHA